MTDYDDSQEDVHASGFQTMEPIRSAANLIVKRIRSLQRRRTRYLERAFVVEGFRAVADVIAAGIVPELVIVGEDAVSEPFMQLLLDHGIRWRTIDERLYLTLTDQPHPQGVLAVVPMLDQISDPTADAGEAPLYLIVDGVRDPGNLGTLLRSAAGAGVDHVLLTPETVDPYNPKVVRAAMGAHFRVPSSQVDIPTVTHVLSSACIAGLAEADGDVSYDLVDWTVSCAIVVGSEANGASALVRERAEMRVRIPLERGVESLNAAVAGSLLMFEVARQRRLLTGETL